MVLLAPAILYNIGTWGSAAAQTAEEQSGPRIHLIDQIVRAPFTPRSTFALVEEEPGKLHQYPAEVVDLRETMTGAVLSRELLAGVALVLPQIRPREHKLSATFFLAGDKSEFAATSVKRWSQEALSENSIDIEELQDGLGRIKEQIEKKRAELASLQESLRPLREKASRIASVDEIIDLKMELESLKGFSQEKMDEVERLNRLVENARRLPDPERIDERRHELSLHLREAARATSMADRLNDRRKRASVVAFHDKLRKVKETANVDAEVLAREVLRLRAQRKELEERLNLAKTNAGEDF